MKKYNIKKRLAALRSGLMLSLFVISPFSVFKAANFNVIVTNEYGSFTRGNWSASILNTTYSTSAVIGELNGVYNGRVTINYSTDPTTTDLLFIPINCSMESSSGNSITIIFKNVSSFMVLIDGSGADSLQVNSMTGWNMTKISDGTNTQLNNVISYIDNLETLITTNNTTLGLIYNYIQTLDTSNTDISIDVGDIMVDVNDIEVGIGDLLSALTDMITDGINTITLGDLLDELVQANSYLANIGSKLQLIQGSLQTIITSLSNIENNITLINSNVQSVKNNVADIKSYINNVVTTLNSINTTLSDIDNKIDIITWINKSSFVYSISTTSYNEGFNDMIANSTYGNTVYIKIARTNINDNNKIYHFRIPLYTSITNENQLSFTLYNEWGSEVQSIKYIQVRNNRYIDLFINIPYVHNLQYIFKFVSNNTIRSSSMSESEQFYEYIENTDIEYYNLIQYFKNYEYQKLVIDKLNDLEINYNINNNQQTEINNLTTDINNIDTVINNNVEVFSDNKIDILTRLNNLERLSMNGSNSLLNRIYRVQETLYSKIFTGNAAEFINNYLWYMLFGVLIVMLLG